MKYRGIIIGVLGICFIGLTMLLFGKDNSVMVGVYVPATLVFLLSTPSNIERLYFIFVGLFLGITELWLVHTGIWIYTNPTGCLKVPIWLPFTWAFLAIFLKRMTDSFNVKS